MMVLKGIQAVYPQCAECLYHFKSQKLLINHMCGGMLKMWLISSYKHGRLQEGDGEPISRQKKARVTYEELDLDINLSKWKKKELEAYLTHHKHCKDREQP